MSIAPWSCDLMTSKKVHWIPFYIAHPVVCPFSSYMILHEFFKIVNFNSSLVMWPTDLKQGSECPECHITPSDVCLLSSHAIRLKCVSFAVLHFTWVLKKTHFEVNKCSILAITICHMDTEKICKWLYMVWSKDRRGVRTEVLKTFLG